MGMFDRQGMKFHRLWISTGEYGTSGELEIENDKAKIEFKLSEVAINRILKVISEDEECKKGINNSLMNSVGINPDKWSLND